MGERALQLAAAAGIPFADALGLMEQYSPGGAIGRNLLNWATGSNTMMGPAQEAADRLRAQAEKAGGWGTAVETASGFAPNPAELSKLAAIASFATPKEFLEQFVSQVTRYRERLPYIYSAREKAYYFPRVFHGTHLRIRRANEAFKDPGIHLGSPAAAYDRMYGTASPVDEKGWSLPGRATQTIRPSRIIDGTVTVKNPLNTPDNPFTEYEMDNALYRAADRLNPHDLPSGASVDEFSGYRGARQLRHEGFDSIFYKNDIEQPGSVSIYLLDPKQFNPKHAAVVGPGLWYEREARSAEKAAQQKWKLKMGKP